MIEPTGAEVLARAMRLWDERELRFPPFTRMPWTQGTVLARSCTLDEARDQLIAERVTPKAINRQGTHVYRSE